MPWHAEAEAEPMEVELRYQIAMKRRPGDGNGCKCCLQVQSSISTKVFTKKQQVSYLYLAYHNRRNHLHPQ